MRTRIAIRGLAVAAVLGLGLLVTACAPEVGEAAGPSDSSGASSGASSGNGASETAPPEGSDSGAAQDAIDAIEEALDGPEGEDGRAYGIGPDDAVHVAEQALASKNATAEWAGNVLRVSLDGSVDDITVGTPCLAMEMMLVEGERALLIYPDGEFDCSLRAQ